MSICAKNLEYDNCRESYFTNAINYQKKIPSGFLANMRIQSSPVSLSVLIMNYLIIPMYLDACRMFSILSIYLLSFLRN